MAKFNAVNVLNFLFEDEEAGEVSEDELPDECEFHGDEEDEEDKEKEKEEEKSDIFNIVKKNDTIVSSTQMSLSISTNSFKKPSYIPSANSLMSISSSRFSIPTPEKTINSGCPISTNVFFPYAPTSSQTSKQKNPSKIFKL